MIQSHNNSDTSFYVALATYYKNKCNMHRCTSSNSLKIVKIATVYKLNSDSFMAKYY